MATLSFNGTGSNRTNAKIKALIPGVWSVAAGLRTKRRSYRKTNFTGDIEALKPILRGLGCTLIKVE